MVSLDELKELSSQELASLYLHSLDTGESVTALNYAQGEGGLLKAQFDTFVADYKEHEKSACLIDASHDEGLYLFDLKKASAQEIASCYSSIYSSPEFGIEVRNHIIDSDERFQNAFSSFVHNIGYLEILDRQED